MLNFRGVRCVIVWMQQISEIFDTSRRFRETKKNRNSDDPVEGRPISILQSNKTLLGTVAYPGSPFPTLLSWFSFFQRVRSVSFAEGKHLHTIKLFTLFVLTFYHDDCTSKVHPTCCLHIDSTYRGPVVNYIPQISKPDTEHMVYLPTFGYLFMVYVGEWYRIAWVFLGSFHHNLWIHRKVEVKVKVKELQSQVDQLVGGMFHGLGGI